MRMRCDVMGVQMLAGKGSWLSGNGQLDDDARSAAVGNGAFRSDAAPHSLHDPHAYGKAESRARRAAVAVADAVKLLEYALEILFGYPRPPVCDGEHDPIPRPADLHLRRRVGSCVLVGVVEQVEDHLLDQRRVAAHERQTGRDLEFRLAVGEA